MPIDIDTTIGLIILVVSSIGTAFAWAIRVSTKLAAEVQTLKQQIQVHLRDEKRAEREKLSAVGALREQIADLNKSVARLEGVLSRNGIKER